MMQAHTRGEKSGLEAQDGYETIAGSVNPISTLRREILSIFEAVRFWEKGVEWLQVDLLKFFFVVQEYPCQWIHFEMFVIVQ